MLSKFQVQSFTSSEEFDEIVLGSIEDRIQSEVSKFRSDGIAERMWAVSALFDLKSDLNKKKRVDDNGDS